MVLMEQSISLAPAALQQLLPTRMELQVHSHIIHYAFKTKPSRIRTCMVLKLLGCDGPELLAGFVLVHDLEVLDVRFAHLAGSADDALLGDGLGLVMLVVAAG